ncbi:hypothetical protein D3C81_832740 [compost metagenome]
MRRINFHRVKIGLFKIFGRIAILRDDFLDFWQGYFSRSELTVDVFQRRGTDGIFSWVIAINLPAGMGYLCGNFRPGTVYSPSQFTMIFYQIIIPNP